MNDDFDDLDRAIFALPLETPPAGLRESILSSTVYAVVARPAFASWEILGIGAALALAVWLVILAVANHAFAIELAENVAALVRGLAQPTMLGWVAAGGAVAIASTLSNGRLPRLPLRNGRS